MVGRALLRPAEQDKKPETDWMPPEKGTLEEGQAGG